MTRISWLVLALVHLLPALALVRPSLITTLYGVDQSSSVFLLLWHRAALFAVILLICGWAAVQAEVRPLATVAVAISMLGFLLLYALRGMPADLRPIAIADLVGLPFLVVVAWSAFKPA